LIFGWLAQNLMRLKFKNSFMKRNYVSLPAILIALMIWSCNNGNNTSSSSTDSSGTSNSSSTTAAGGSTSTADSGNTNAAKNTNTPTGSTASTNMTLSKSDSTFIMKAAAGGLMEVQLGNVAQQNAMNARVKNFGQMMVNDHSKANDELKSLASSKGITLPSDLPGDKMKHVDAMKNMKGNSFDTHYMSMMVNDHKEDISEFEKASKTAKDPDLKNWATKTLPTLKTHLDSAKAISKGKM
jgi:putative membrane protein